MKQRILITIISIVIVFVAAGLGIYYGTKKITYRAVVEGIVIEKDDKEYSPKLITSYNEYVDFLDDYDINELVFLTSGDLDNNDYIIDFINYDEDLKIDSIDIDVTDDGINLKYVVNKVIDDSDEYLMYFIPIDDGLLDNFVFNKREFEEK